MNAQVIKNFVKSKIRKYKLITQTSKCLPEVTCIDVGASYYPHPAWECFRHSQKTTWVAVEPNHQNLKYIDHWKYPSKVFTVKNGLSQNGGEQTLYVTNTDSGSSLLKPIVPQGEEHRYDLNYFFPVKEVKINTLTLSEVVTKYVKNTPVTIKLDTQGSEFMILKGLDTEFLKTNVACIEMEINMRARSAMSGASKFYEVQQYLESIGMELVKLKPIAGTMPSYSGKLKNECFLNECDAVFFLRQDIAEAKGKEYLLTLVGLYVSYQFLSEAKHLIEKLISSKKLTPEEESNLINLIEIIQ